MTAVGKKLKALGFKKIPGTEPGFHMYELTPARLPAASAAPNAKRASSQANKLASEQARKRTSSQANKLDK
jgi:hypothetical protein